MSRNEWRAASRRATAANRSAQHLERRRASRPSLGVAPAPPPPPPRPKQRQSYHQVHRAACMADHRSSFIAPLTTLLAPVSTRPSFASPRGAHRLRTSPPCRSRIPPRSCWQQQLLPDESSAQRLRALQTAPSSEVTKLAPHTVTNTHLHAVDLTSEHTIALPFDSPDERNLLLDTLSLTHFLPPQSPIPPRSALIITTSVPSSLRAFLGLDAATCNTLAAHIVRDGRVNRAVALRQALITCGVKCLACEVYEAEGMGHTLPVEALAFLTWMDDERQVMEVQLPAAVAVALAAVCEVPCYTKRALVQAAGVPARAAGAPELVPEGRSPEPAQQAEPPLEATQLLADDILNMSQQTLLQTVRRCGIGARSDDSRQQLFKRLLPKMCEVQRREMAIELAAEQGRYDLAAELQNNRSQRGVLFARMREMERMGNLSEALSIAERLRELAADKQDVSLEPGSYDQYLDRDEWYRPTR